MDLQTRLNEIHRRMCAGSRTASKDLFLTALDPLRGFLAKRFASLPEDDLHDLATDAILLYVANPEVCNTDLSSLWSYLCRVAKADAVDLLRKRGNREELLTERTETDVDFWASRTKEVFRGEDAIDARHIMQMHGHKLVTNDIEAEVLALILCGESSTASYAAALGLDPKAPEVERVVKQAKDRMLLRLKRVRDEL